MSNSLSLVSGMAQRNEDLESKSSICKICGISDVIKRRYVEELMAKGVSNNAIISYTRDSCNIELNAKDIAKHVEHLPAKYYTYKEIIEKRLKEDGISLDDDSARLSPVAYIEMIMHDAADTLVENPGTTNQFIGMSAAKTLIQLEREKQDNQDIVQWILRFKQLISAVKMYCTPSQIQSIMNVMKNSEKED